MTTKKKAMTRADLERKVIELESQLIHRYHFADAEIGKAGTNHLMTSGVILQLTVLGGRKITEPVLIRDGLSAETIDAIRADLRRSYELTAQLKPKGC